MAHLIKENDIIASIESCWHGLEKLKKEIITFEDTETDIEIIECPIVALQKEIDGSKNILEIPDYKSLFGQRQDGPLFPLSIQKKSYGLVPNKTIFEMIENSLKGIDYKIVSAGTLDNCKKVFYCVEFLDDQKYLVNGDEFKTYTVFKSSHDASEKLEAYDTATRVVCNNTLQWSKSEKGILKMTTRHSKNVLSRIPNLEKSIAEMFIKRKEFFEKIEKLDKMKITSDDAQYILAAFNANGDKLSTRAYNTIQTQKNLFENGKGNKGKSAYDLLNGVTEYFTHLSKSETKSQVSSSEFGLGADKKVEFSMLLNNANLDQIADKGEKLLNDYVTA